MRTAIFLERDGILNEANLDARQGRSPQALQDFHVIGQAIEPLSRLKSMGFVLISITNQPCISRGTPSRRELELMHIQVRQQLGVDDIFVCPHDEMDGCPCRKPKPGLIFEAAFKWQLELNRCFVVSDKWQDAQAAQLAGCRSVLIQSPWIGSCHRDFVVADLAGAASKIEQIQWPKERSAIPVQDGRDPGGARISGR